ncbi:uncharacterized protein LOC111135577 isoform X2 [Crassostrea virginica]
MGFVQHRIIWFLIGLILAVFTSRVVVAEDGQNKTVSTGFPNFKSIANSFSRTVNGFFKKTLSIFKHHPDNATSSENKATSTVLSNTTELPQTNTTQGLDNEKPERKKDNYPINNETQEKPAGGGPTSDT